MGSKRGYVGAFDTAEKASAARQSVMNILATVDRSSLSQKERNDHISAAIEKVNPRDLPLGVTRSRRRFDDRRFLAFYSSMGDGKSHYIGIFDTAEEASTAYQSVHAELSGVDLSSLSEPEKKNRFKEARDNAAA